MNEIVALEKLVPANVFVPKGGDPIIDAIRREVLSVDRDISTEDGRETVRKLAYKVARSKTFLDEAGKTFVADKKQEIKSVDAERGRIWDALDALQKEVRQPLTECEEREKQRTAGHEAVLLQLEQATIFDGFTPSSAQVKERIDGISAHSSRAWEEFAKRGYENYARVSSQLSTLLAERKRFEYDQIELERLRREQVERDRVQREEALKAEAAETARLAAESVAKAEAEAAEIKATAERDAVEREKRHAEERAARAEQEKLDAELKAERDLKEAHERSERERKAAEEKAFLEKEEAVRHERELAETNRRAEEVAAVRREADLKHRSQINNAALKALVEAGIPEAIAKKAVEAIARRQIPYIAISY